MNTRFCKTTARLTCIFSFLFLLLLEATWAQAPSGTLRGQVTDPSSAGIEAATILATGSSGDSKGAATAKDGTFEIKDLPPGTYQVKAIAKGFALFTKEGVVITAGQTARVSIEMTIEVQQEKVVVNDTSTNVDVDPSNNANTIVMQGKDLDALSDDPDELQSELQALAGPSAGPNGGQIYIDGFTGGQLPPKASIREIRINQNPFSSEYDKLGYGRIEVFTKPGTDSLHGQFLVSGNSSYFNSRNPYEATPGPGESLPSYQSTQYSASIGGAINKKSSFFFNLEQRNIGNLAIFNGSILGPAPTYEIIPNYSVTVANPQNRTNLSPRIDYQITPTNSLTVRYQFFRNTEQNDNVGQFDLPEYGVNDYETEDTFQATDTQIIGAHVINEVRFQYIRDNSETTPLNLSPTVSVGGAFVGNGSGSAGKATDVQNHYELQNITYYNRGKHAFKFGGRVRSTGDTNTTTSDFSGTYTFGSRLLPGCIPLPANNCQITPLEAYQITEIGLYNGLSIPQIQALGGGASYYTQTIGIPQSVVNVVDGALFAQDDWKVRQNVTVSLGLRWETQNDLSNNSDFAPRLGVAWGIGGTAKNPPKTVLRAGFGMFYDRFLYNEVLNQVRFNGVVQSSYQVTNPDFFLTNVQLPANPTNTIYQYNPNLHAPYTIQTGVTLERQLTKTANIAVTYLNSRGDHQFYTESLNPADPITGVRPDGNNNIYQYQSEGTFKQNQVIVNGSIRMGAKLSVFGYYVLNYSDSDTSGANTFPSVPGNISLDYGRATFDIRNRVFMGGTIGLPKGFRVSPFLIASSGIPFNITTGADPYQDSQFNVRPVFAPCATAVYVTKFGCFRDGIPGTIGYTPIPVNYGDGPGRFALNLRLSKTIGFGPTVENAANSGGGGMGGGTFGRGPGGGGRGGGPGGRMDAGASNKRYALTFAVSARNIFNNVNVATPIGTLGTPLFGESNALAGRPYSDNTSNRRIDLQATFTF
ncbi:MAG: carboxypeptidase-like regulatory domain-containing protein [Candidatus Acidiferrum sp.]